MGAIAGVGNACLLYWMIHVTRRYVDINAKILAAAASSAKVAARQEMLSRERFRDELRQRIGPTVLSIEELLDRLTRWSQACGDVLAQKTFILASPEALCSAELEVVARVAGTVSLSAARCLVSAAAQLRRLDIELIEVRRRLREDDDTGAERIGADVRREVVPLITRVTESLQKARDEITAFAAKAESPPASADVTCA
jgi:hypothetical protein